VTLESLSRDCFADQNVYGEKSCPPRVAHRDSETIVEPGATTSFSPIAAQPAPLGVVALKAAFVASSPTSASALPVQASEPGDR